MIERPSRSRSGRDSISSRFVDIVKEITIISSSSSRSGAKRAKSIVIMMCRRGRREGRDEVTEGIKKWREDLVVRISPPPAPASNQPLLLIGRDRQSSRRFRLPPATAMSASSSTAKKKDCAIIFLHGLGDVSARLAAPALY